jgi:hypothetical protein
MKKILEGQDSKEGVNEADEAAEAISSLDIKKSEDVEKS